MSRALIQEVQDSAEQSTLLNEKDEPVGDQPQIPIEVTSLLTKDTEVAPDKRTGPCPQHNQQQSDHFFEGLKSIKPSSSSKAWMAKQEQAIIKEEQTSKNLSIEEKIMRLAATAGSTQPDEDLEGLDWSLLLIIGVRIIALKNHWGEGGVS